MTILPLCLQCVHLDGGKSFTCPAFPQGIPMDVLVNKLVHRRILPGQMGRLIFTDKKENREMDTKNTGMDSKGEIVGAVPVLRFPEFRGAGAWEEKTLGEVCRSFSGGTPSTLEKGYYNGDIPFIRSAEIAKESTELFLTEAGFRNSAAKMVEKGDVLFALYGANSGEVAISKQAGAINQAIICLKSEGSNSFIYHFLTNKQLWIVRRYIQGGQGNLSGEIVKSIDIQIPKLPEQQKIAACLSSLDDTIAAESEKLAALKGQKQGLMQGLLPAEGETVPRLRFAGFEGEWEEKALIDVTDKKVKWSFTGGPFGSNLQSHDYVANGVRIIQLQNIGDGEFHNSYKIFTSENKAEELLSCNIYPGDIIMSKMGDPVGRACLIPDTHSRYVMCSDGIRVVVDTNRFDKYFIYSLINSTQFRPLVEKTATGSTRKRIGLDELKKLPLIVPSQRAEQQKIASTLSSLDDLISLQSQKLEALRLHKRGLMQGLFPATQSRTDQ